MRYTYRGVCDVDCINFNKTAIRQRMLLISGNDYVTNLPLQMAIYFNVFFAPFWILVTIVGFEVKVIN